MTDDQIRAAILNHFAVELQNFGGDNLDETLEGDEADYDRAQQLLAGAELTIKFAEVPSV